MMPREPPQRAPLGQPGAAPPAQKNGTATLAMWLGFASLFTFGVTGIPALILGIKARRAIVSQPGRFSNSGHALVAIVMGSLGACFAVLCLLGAVFGDKSKTPSSAPSVSASAPVPSVPEAAFVDTIARLPGAPTTALKPSKAHLGANKQEQVYEYGDPAGLPGHGLEVTVRKSNPAAWLVGFWEQKSGVRAKDFAPTGGVSEVHQPEGVGNVYEIHSGPFEGAIMWRTPLISDWPADGVGNGRMISVMSVEYAIDGGLPDPMIGWLCEGVHPDAGGRTIDKSTFKVECESMVKAKLLSPKTADFPDGLFDSVPIATTKRCGRSWDAWVDAKNAFGVPIRHTFVCTYDTSTNLVSLTLN